MTYEMRMKDLRNEAFYEGEAIGMAKGEAVGMAKGRAVGMAKGRAEGEAKGKFEATKNLMSTLSCSIDRAMDMLKTHPEERQFYKDLLSKNA